MQEERIYEELRSRREPDGSLKKQMLDALARWWRGSTGGQSIGQGGEVLPLACFRKLD